MQAGMVLTSLQCIPMSVCKCPAIAQASINAAMSADEELDDSVGAAWSQLPLPSLQHVPLKALSAGASKLGQCSRQLHFS